MICGVPIIHLLLAGRNIFLPFWMTLEISVDLYLLAEKREVADFMKFFCYGANPV